MRPESATSTYIIAEPFPEALKLVRKVLAAANLKLTGELDMSGRIQRSLLVQTSPCRVLFACPMPAPEDGEDDLQQAALAPFHIVLSARGERTEVHFLRVLPKGDAAQHRRSSAVFARVQAAIAEAIGTVGMRAGLGA